MNEGFRNQPPAVRQINGTQWQVVELNFSYNPWKIRDVENIEVPEFFVTDFASIPRALWFILHPTGKYGSAAIVHDYLTREAVRNANYIAPTHKIAALVFRDAMTELGVGAFTRSAMYRAVMWFGPKWNKNK